MSKITVEHNPSEERLKELGVAQWEIWEKEVSKFPIDFDETEYAYVMPIRQQALWLAKSLAGQTSDPWPVPEFKPRAKVHGFTAAHPYLF